MENPVHYFITMAVVLAFLTGVLAAFAVVIGSLLGLF